MSNLELLDREQSKQLDCESLIGAILILQQQPTEAGPKKPDHELSRTDGTNCQASIWSGPAVSVRANT